VDVQVRINRRARCSYGLAAAFSVAAAIAWGLAAPGHPAVWAAAAVMGSIAAVQVRQLVGWQSDGALELDRDRLAAAVRRACERAAHTSPPAVVLIASPIPSIGVSVASGRAILRASSAAIAALDDAHLDALMLHELAHVRSGTYARVVRRIRNAGRLLQLPGAFAAGAAIGSGQIFPWLALILTDMAIGRWAGLVFRGQARREEFAADRDALALGADPQALAEALRVHYARCQRYASWLTRGPLWWLLSRPHQVLCIGAPRLEARLAAIGRAAA
jgi:Zn-dependent protease with chaperone function